MALSGYLELVQSLSTNNLFSTTLQIFVVQSTGNTQEQRVSGIGVVTASFAVFVVSVLTGAAMCRYRKRRRRQASEKFLKDVDSTFGVTTMANINEGDLSLGVSKEVSRRIEVTLCETEQDDENLSDYVFDNEEEEIIFEKE
jgi:hypothetical protein